MATVVFNGNTYADNQGEADRYMSNGGHRTWFFPLLQDFLADAGRVFVTTSTSTYTLGSGTGSVLMAAPIPFAAGSFVILADASAPTTNYALVQVSSVSGSTLNFSEELVVGSGEKSAWTVSISGPRGAKGDTGSLSGGTLSGNLDTGGNLLTVDEFRMRKGIQWLNAESEKPDAVSGAQEIVLVDNLFHWLHINGTTPITITPDAAAGHGTAGQLLVQQDATGGRGHSFVGVGRWIGGTAPNPSMDANYKALYGFEVAIDGTVLGWLIDEGF